LGDHDAVAKAGSGDFRARRGKHLRGDVEAEEPGLRIAARRPDEVAACPQPISSTRAPRRLEPVDQLVAAEQVELAVRS